MSLLLHNRNACLLSVGARPTAPVTLMQDDLLDVLLAATPAVLTGAARIVTAKVPIIKCNLAAGVPLATIYRSLLLLFLWSQT